MLEKKDLVTVATMALYEGIGIGLGYNAIVELSRHQGPAASILALYGAIAFIMAQEIDRTQSFSPPTDPKK